MRRWIAVAALAVGAAVVGCSHTPPQELVDARVFHVTAEQGEVDETVPEAWRDAQTALRNANEAWAMNKSKEEIRDLSYVAIRQTQRAEALARIEKLKRRQQEALSFLAENEERGDRRLRAELRQTQEQLAQLEQQRKLEEQSREEARRAQAEQQTLAEQQRLEAEAEAQRQRLAEAEAARQRELEEERQARLAAEQEAAEARAQLDARLKELAQVREEARGTVLTLSGTLLFAPGKATLLPAAQRRLDQLAEVLKKMPEQKLRIEGHTDAQGPEPVNEALSLKRAEAVRGFLVRGGVAPDRIESLGMGEAAPVADNATPDGRAQNRRVEIVLVERPDREQGIGGGGDDEKP